MFPFQHCHTITQHEESLSDEDLNIDCEDDPDSSEALSLAEHMNISHSTIDYFTVANAILCGCIFNVLKPCHTFATATTTFHITNKPSLLTTVDEAATLFGILDLHPTIWEFLQHVQDHANAHDISGIRSQDLHCTLPFDQIQIWYKLRVQQYLYHDDE